MKKTYIVTKKSESSRCDSSAQNSQSDLDEDIQIDLGDMPEWTDEMFDTAKRGHHYIPKKLRDLVNSS